jgi:hypothetical protein
MLALVTVVMSMLRGGSCECERNSSTPGRAWYGWFVMVRTGVVRKSGDDAASSCAQ